MNLPDLLRTSAFRLTLIYAALFVVSVLVLLGIVYWDTVSFLDEQTDESIASEMDELRGQYRQSGMESLRRAIARRGEVFDDGEQIYLLATRDFSPLVGNLRSWPADLRQRSGFLNLALPEEEEQDEDEILENATARALTVRLPGGYRLLVGRDLHEREELQDHTLQVLAVTLALSLILALTGGLIMSRAILRRIETINRLGRSIMAGDLARRVPVTNRGDEFDQLAANLNAMLDQIERLMEGMRQVTDNVAHDLRSPLNRLHSRLEIVLLSPRDNEDYVIAMEQTLEDVDDLLRTFNALLSIAQVESGADRGDFGDIDLSALTREIAELYAPVAEDKGVRFAQHIAQDLQLRGNPHLLTQAIGNLLDNSIKYTPSGGAVQLSAKAVAGSIEVVVSDNGPSIPVEMYDKVLERFVRLEASRTTPGNGLGLSMVRAVAQLHGAKLELIDARPGLKVSLSFPSDARSSESALALKNPPPAPPLLKGEGNKAFFFR